MATIVSRPLTNSAYGFPRGRARRVKPVALACIHITGNKNTAANPDLHDAALDERNYANRAGSDGPSAHDYDARDGWTVRAIDPLKYAAWSNGDVASPNTNNPGIRRVLAMRAKGYNANEAYWLETEEVGYGSTKPITALQRGSIAERIAAIAKAVSMAASRETIHGHWEINGVNRRNCPIAYANRETFLRDIVTRVNRILDAGDTDVVSSFATPEYPGRNATPKEDVARPGNSVWLFSTSALVKDGKEISLKPIRPLQVVSMEIVPGVTALAYEPTVSDTDTVSRVVFVARSNIARSGVNTPPVAVPDPAQLAAARTEGFTDAKSKASIEAQKAATAISNLTES